MVNVGRRAVLVSTRGRVFGHLDGYVSSFGDSIESQIAPAPGPLVLKHSSGRRFIFDRSSRRLVPTADGRIRLVEGAMLVRSGRRWTLRWRRAVSVPPELRRSGPAFVSEGRDLVTVYGARVGRVLDLRTGRWTSVPAGCRAAARRGGRWFLLCGYPWQRTGAETPSTLRVREADGRVRQAVGPAARGPKNIPDGSWAAAYLSPDGAHLLLQWSGECETPNAFFAPASGGKPRPVTGEAGLRGAPESSGLGWGPGGRAFVTLPRGACGGSTSPPGIYLIHPRTGARTLVYRAPRGFPWVVAWRALS